MRKVTLTFNIPDWIPPIHRQEQIYKTWRYKILPFRCEETGVRLNFKHPQYEYQHTKRVMVATYKHVRSREQWIKYVNDYFAGKIVRVGHECRDPAMEITEHTCNSCGHRRPTVGAMPELRFGMNWWNGFHLCQTCITETIRLGAENGAVFALVNGKTWHINEAGALIRPKPQSDEPTTIEVNRDVITNGW